ncbi:MAG: hypothetical protein PHQ23_01510 [Candidatus Wallbacteria bacterium]|nr:hypothetical protein [Candidatus Wallbacteria bacterium]
MSAIKLICLLSLFVITASLPAANSQAWQNGYTAGFSNGRNDGYFRGLSDGQSEGRRDGEWRGRSDGEREGFDAGKRDGEREGREEGLRQGQSDGTSKGSVDGRVAGEKRCYNEGYKTGYNETYPVGYQAGEQTDSYEKGFAKGSKDAAEIETQNGFNAGYKAGFAEKEKEFKDSFWNENPRAEVRESGIDSLMVYEDMDLMILRNTATKDDAADYKQGYDRGYQDGYNAAYSSARQQGYQETYHQAYQTAYQYYYQEGYRDGFGKGKDEGYREGYQEAYDRYYRDYYYSYEAMEYSYERQRGLEKGRKDGHAQGFQDACKKLYDKGYKAGYDKVTAEVYPPSFAKGKTAGIAAADKHYHENAVLEINMASVSEENGDSLYTVGEKLTVKVSAVNFGFVDSMDFQYATTSSSEGVEVAEGPYKATKIAARKSGSASFSFGKVKSDAMLDYTVALKLELKHSGKTVSSQILKFKLNNTKQRIGTTTSSSTVYQGPGKSWSSVTSVSKGEKVVVMEKVSDWYRVFARYEKMGYLKASILQVTWPFAVSPPPVKIAKDGHITTDSKVTVRTGPGTSYPAVVNLGNQAGVTVHYKWWDMEGKTWWYEITTPSGRHGYVHNNYVMLNSDNNWPN